MFARLLEPAEAHGKNPLIRFDVDRALLAESGLSEGASSVTMFGTLRDLARRSEHVFAPGQAVDLLARREHSAQELRRKLRKRGYSEDAVDVAVHEMQRLGYQDDERFAQVWIREKMSGAGTSRAALLAGLLDRGVGRHLAQGAVEAYESEHPRCFEVALENALGKIRTAGAHDTSAALRKLARRGFDLAEIKKALSHGGFPGESRDDVHM